MEDDRKVLLISFNPDFNHFENGLINLSQLNNPIAILDSQDAYETITLTQILSKYEFVNKVIELMTKHNTLEIYADLFTHLYTKRLDFNFKNSRKVIDYNDPNVCYLNTSCNERRIFNLANLEKIFNYTFNLSIEFRRLFTKLNKNGYYYLETMITYIKDYQFIDNFIEFFPKFTGFILNITVISKNADECKNVWHSLNSIEIFLKFALKYPKWNLSAYGAVFNIASDQDIEKITEINEIINNYIEFSNQCINNPLGKRKLQFKDEENETKNQNFDVNYINDSNGNFCSITFLLSSLYRISVNETVKLEICKREEFKNSIKKLIFKGNDIEKQHALQLLAQFVFNSQINEEISNDTALVSYIQDLSKKDNLTYIKLHKTCNEFLWILEKENKRAKPVLTSAQKGHIMISYNTASRDTCLKIKSELEALNLKVWIDVNEIHGSSLDSMAQAVEQAQCVLICISEKYRLSLNCQAEALYAFRLNKTIIPLIMQTGYHNVKGWLGIIVGDKIFVDFTKYKFEESMNRLIKQINLNTATEPIQSNQIKILPTEIKQEKAKDLGIKAWNNEQTKEWFTKNQLEHLYNILSPINGRVLLQLYEIKQHAPEFFFKSLAKNDSIDVMSVAIFSDLLMELFEN